MAPILSKNPISGMPGTGHLIELPNVPVLSLTNHVLFPKQQVAMGGSNNYLPSIGQIKVWTKLFSFFHTGI